MRASILHLILRRPPISGLPEIGYLVGKSGKPDLPGTVSKDE
jgi:hypothetical protein